MKLEVTQKGVIRDGQAVEVGATIEIDGDTIPTSLVNKVKAYEGKTAITNPASGALQQPELDREQLKAEAKELDIDHPKNIPTEKLKELIDAKLAE